MGETAVLDLEELRQWIGRTESAQDTITPRLEASLRATLDRSPEQPTVGDSATLGVHWCLAPPIVPTDALGDDGHPLRGGFLPPVPLPRRMWAGGELAFEAPLQVGDTVTRTSQIEDVAIKEGRSGTMCFVTVRHSWATERGPALEERQDIVYRAGNAGRPAAAIPAEVSLPQASCQRVWPCDPVLLLRYSALTFNGHRIHYDYPYVTEVEGYPGLVVHGPLQATLLMSLAVEARGGTPRRFAFRGVAPLIAGRPIVAKAGPNRETLRLWIEDADGRTTMTADASW
jgi:3-methylfumaryl-CoA hydratase